MVSDDESKLTLVRALKVRGQRKESIASKYAWKKALHDQNTFLWQIAGSLSMFAGHESNFCML